MGVGTPSWGEAAPGPARGPSGASAGERTAGAGSAWPGSPLCASRSGSSSGGGRAGGSRGGTLQPFRASRSLHGRGPSPRRPHEHRPAATHCAACSFPAKKYKKVTGKEIYSDTLESTPMLEKEKFPQDYFPEVGAGPGRQAAAERPEQALRPGGVASPWLFPGTGALAAPHTGCARPARLWGGRGTVSSAASCPGGPGGLWPASRRGGRRAQRGSGSAGSPAPAAEAVLPASGCGRRGAGGTGGGSPAHGTRRTWRFRGSRCRLLCASDT